MSPDEPQQSPPRPSDAQLMKRAGRGDRDAFETLVHRHQAAVFRLCYRYLGSRPEAEDVAQDTFVRLFEAAPRYRPTAAVRAYLLTIATRLCLNRKARFYASRELTTEPSVVDALQSSPDPELDVLRQERRQTVRAAVLELPDEQRMAIVLCRFEGLTYAEAGQVMGKSESAVTSLLWRANRALRETLAPVLASAAPLTPQEKISRKDSRRRRLDETGAKTP